MQWHCKLGHLGFDHTQTLGTQGFLDKFALGLLRSALPDAPKCASCQYGKQVWLTDKTTATTNLPEIDGALKSGILQPGQRVFGDQLESRVRGRLFHTAGRDQEKNKFCASSIFYDGASGYIHCEHQVSTGASDSINAKEGFERTAAEFGV